MTITTATPTTTPAARVNAMRRTGATEAQIARVAQMDDLFELPGAATPEHPDAGTGAMTYRRWDADGQCEYSAVISEDGTLEALTARYSAAGMDFLRIAAGDRSVEAWANWTDVEGGGIWDSISA